VSQPLSYPIRVFVAETSPISSQLLAEAIARDLSIEVLGFASDSSQVAEIVHASSVDVLLISARMQEDPNRGLLVLRELRRDRPSLKAVVLLDSSKPAAVVQAFRSGACGVFCRSMPIEMLCKCIAAVRNGQIWANSEELGYVLADLGASEPFQLDRERLKLVSAREREVIRCLVEGRTNREIAQVLEISRHTVKNYIFKIFDKLGVSNRVELVFQVLCRTRELGLSQTRDLQGSSAASPSSVPSETAARMHGDRFPNLVVPGSPKFFLGSGRKSPSDIS
jgi:two-component system, NarL family, nitrate/nitrite response regulator NarL